MFTRILFSALVAGIAAGLLVAVLQSATTTPLIIEAERFEAAAPAADGHEDHDHGAEAWAPADGTERVLYTSLGTIGTTFGFALILLSAMQLAGETITPRAGLLWGLAGFAATGLAPALGLAPELPGSAAAELVARQTWWIGTALATAAGLWLALRVSTSWAIGIGLALIVAPHVIGAPQAAEHASGVPAELAAEFAGASLVVHAVTWVLTGLFVGLAWERRLFAAGPAPAHP